VEQVTWSRACIRCPKYINYREKPCELREQTAAYWTTKDTIDNYQPRPTGAWGKRQHDPLLPGLMLHLSGTDQAPYRALEKYPEEVRLAHEHGYFHLHDLSFGCRYCRLDLPTCSWRLQLEWPLLRRARQSFRHRPGQ
jgi:ribonucleoside-triphosphate reductase